MSDQLRASTEAGVRTLLLNRPDKRNALNQAMIEALLSELEDAEINGQVRVVAVRGAGKDFCAGADLAELLESADRSAEDNAASAARLGEVFRRMRALPKPVVAVVHGRALAGGCGLASACDLIVARADAQFGYPEVSRGFVPAMVMTMLRRATSEAVAFDLVATGRVLAAHEAAAVGLVARVYGADEFEDRAADVLTSLVATSGSALAMIKKQLYELDGRSFDEGIRLGASVNALAQSTPDFKKAVAAFLKR